MDTIQEQFERSAGDSFVAWYNAMVGARFSFAARGDRAPDLLYRDGDALLTVEITSAYYDSADAQVKWQNARGVPGAPQSWSGSNVSDRFRANIQDVIRSKCIMRLGANCMLVIHVKPPGHTASDMEALLRSLALPPHIPYRGIYLSGDFGYTTSEAGGYRCWLVAGGPAADRIEGA